MKKLMTALLTIGLLTTAYPAHSMDAVRSWAKKNIFALVGAGIAVGLAYLLYKRGNAVSRPKAVPMYHAHNNHMTYSLGDNPNIIIMSYFPGSIRVIGEDRKDIHIEEAYDSPSPQPVTIERYQSRFYITAGEFNQQNAYQKLKVAQVNLILRVPKTSRLQITHPISDALIDNIDGEIATDAYEGSKGSGSTIIKNAGGKVTTSSGTGSLKIHGGKNVYAFTHTGTTFISGGREKVMARSETGPITLDDCENIITETDSYITITNTFPLGSVPTTATRLGKVMVDGRIKQSLPSLPA